LGGASSHIEPDGHSLVALFGGGGGGDWRDAALVEHHHPIPNATDPDAPVPHGGNPPTYEALRMHGAMYVEYEGGEVGYYDLKRDPEELNNVAKDLPAAKRSQLHNALAANKACKGTESCWAAQKIPR
jgi:N-acetylglucosamine-6-sulfatase